MMKKYKEVNWSEVARRAIVEKILSLKATREGLTREELAMLLEATGRSMPVRKYGHSVERNFLEAIKKREKRRRELLNKLEK